MMPLRLRVLLADDHALVRAGLAQLLRNMPGVEVVGEASDGDEVVALGHALQPDLVLMDISMPKRNGLQACAALTEAQKTLRVVVLSMHTDLQYVRKALQSGATGYLLKDAAPAELHEAIETVMQGRTYLSTAVSQGMLRDAVQGLQTPVSDLSALTSRQREVLTLVAKGMSTKEIAIALDLSVKTVDSHRTNLMGLLHIHEVTGLVRYAIRHGLISAED
jgi:DNA-binding NarL/FixJ family response regulator